MKNAYDLLHFLVRRLLAAGVAKFLGLQSVGVLLFIFCGGVIPVLAISTLQSNDFPHFLNSFSNGGAGFPGPRA
jgi:hypothetical protein